MVLLLPCNLLIKLEFKFYIVKKERLIINQIKCFFIIESSYYLIKYSKKNENTI